MKYDIESIQKRKQINKRIKKVLFIFCVIILYNIVLLFVSYVDKFETPNFYIYKAYIIVKDSMSPNINIGDMIIIKKVEQNDLKVGDIITYKLNGEIITHRITDIAEVDSNLEYKTKGDNNNIEDCVTIKFENIEGKKVLKIPFIGNLMSILKSGIVIILITLLVLIIFLYKIEKEEKSEIRRRKKQEFEKENKNNN